jgi:hypothetical protein
MRSLSILVLITAAAQGCAASRAYEASDDWSDASAMAEAVPSDVAPMAFGAEGGAPTMKTASPGGPALSSTAPTPTASEKAAVEASKRLIIYTGALSVMVPQTEPAIVDFLAHVEGAGGHLQNRAGTSITVRVPAERFFATLAWVRTHGQVTDESVNADDVTKRVFDLELRLQVAEESKKRMLKLLESATKMEDILSIERELRRLTDEIEGLKGELRHLSDQVAFSTLTVSFFADAPEATPYPRRTRSRFPWVNQVGIERVLSNF